MTTRLNKFLAANMGISRREADDLIAAGLVTVNNNVAKLGTRIEDDDIIAAKGEKIVATKLLYLMMNKPSGYVSSRKKQGTSPTLYDLLPKKYRQLKTVGRLDKNSSGLILLTNDGDFAFKMTHPSFVKEKVYQVKLDKKLSADDKKIINDNGVELPDGISRLGLKQINEDRKKWQVTMHEGRNRQIRRTFAALGYEVINLHRIRFGKYSLDELKSGEIKIVDKV